MFEIFIDGVLTYHANTTQQALWMPIRGQGPDLPYQSFQYFQSVVSLLVALGLSQKKKTIGGGRGKFFQPINKLALPLEKLFSRHYPYHNFFPSPAPIVFFFLGQPLSAHGLEHACWVILTIF